MADYTLVKLREKPQAPSVYALVGDRLNDLFDPGLRHKSGQKPADYLRQWLSMLRPFAFATQDDSWGEMEKLLCIVMSEYVRALRLFPEAAERIESLQAEVDGLKEALKPFAEQPTIDEIMAGKAPSEWADASVERRIEMIAERKQKKTADILRARSALAAPASTPLEDGETGR